MAEYPLPKFHFEVQWGDKRKGAFTEVSGLDVESEVIEYREGTSKEYSKIKMPGLKKFSNLTLKRGTFTGDNTFFEWWSTIQLNQVERETITISLLNENHEAVLIWEAKNAWPIKIQSTDLKAEASEVAVESMEVAHEGLTIVNKG